MPIYAYKCSACGFAKDVLQKMSDTALSVCLSCGAPTFSKQLTAAGFQLKGSGWYVTDFREGGGKKAADKGDDKGDNKGGESAGDKTPEKAGAESSAAAVPAKSAEAANLSAKAAPAAPAPASAPAAKAD